MTRSDQWREICDRLQQAESPLASPLVVELVTMAAEDGPHILRKKRLDASSSEDLVQDALARILMRFDEFLKAKSPRQYFATTLIRLAIDQRRPSRARREVLREDIEGVPGSQPSTHETALRQAEIARAFAKLPPREAQALSACAGGADGSEVAVLLGVTRDNAFQIISRARKRLRQLLEEEP